MIASKNSIKSDLTKSDAHRISADEYDEAPEFTAEQLARATAEIGGVPVPARRGRPPAAFTKLAINLRLDPEIVAYFKEAGAGWQTMINKELSDLVRRKKRSKNLKAVRARSPKKRKPAAPRVPLKRA